MIMFTYNIPIPQVSVSNIAHFGGKVLSLLDSIFERIATRGKYLQNVSPKFGLQN